MSSRRLLSAVLYIFTVRDLLQELSHEEVEVRPPLKRLKNHAADKQKEWDLILVAAAVSHGLSFNMGAVGHYLVARYGYSTRGAADLVGCEDPSTVRKFVSTRKKDMMRAVDEIRAEADAEFANMTCRVRKVAAALELFQEHAK